jgi:hypothetical protein
VLDYAVREAFEKGRLEGEQKVALRVGSEMKKENYPIPQIARIT